MTCVNFFAGTFFFRILDKTTKIRTRKNLVTHGVQKTTAAVHLYQKEQEEVFHKIDDLIWDVANTAPLITIKN